MTTAADSRLDRLYHLVPAIYRMRDAEQGYPLQALLRVIAEQVNVVEDDIARLYENWFIETAEDWAVPYIADLIGYRPVREAGSAGDVSDPDGRALNRVLVPRREAANTIRYRRRKGTLAVLELLGRDVAGWPCHAVEFFKRLGWHQNLNHAHENRARIADLRRVEDLDRIGSAFDAFARTVDVRRIDSQRTPGRHNIPSVGLFVWRLKNYSITRAPAHCMESVSPASFTFSVLGQDAPLFVKPDLQADEAEMRVPAPIRRLAFDRHKDRFYGESKSFAIWAQGWGGTSANQPIPAAALIPADLSKWQYTPPPKFVAVDPKRGRFVFPPGDPPKKGVRVSYHYGFSADIGGGEYARSLLDPQPRRVEEPAPDNAEATLKVAKEPVYYRVGKGEAYQRLTDALTQWRADEPWDAVVELIGSNVYTEPVSVSLGTGRSLQIRAASGSRPIIRLIDWGDDTPDALYVTMGQGSRFALDGIMIAGRPLHISAPDQKAEERSPSPRCDSEVLIRHCTLVPGWSLDSECCPKQPSKASLQLYNIQARLTIDHSIVGAIQIQEDEVMADSVPVVIRDSIVDATSPSRFVLSAPAGERAHATATIERSTLIGIAELHAIELADASIFMGCLNVARRQIGCMRFCYVPPGCRTPKRYRCQPDMVVQAVAESVKDPVRRAAVSAAETQRVRPQFTFDRYGRPAYMQLAHTCAPEIRRGAEDESEMGVFHNLFQPQREANLAARLDEYTPAGMDAGILFET